MNHRYFISKKHQEEEGLVLKWRLWNIGQELGFWLEKR